MNQIELEPALAEAQLMTELRRITLPTKPFALGDRQIAVKTAIVIPAYKVRDSIEQVIVGIPAFIDHIIVVDDACPEGSGRLAQQVCDRRVTTIFHEKNQGVGGAVVTGYRKAIEFHCDIIIKMDGDGQMKPQYIESLIRPLISGKADYTKGNRYHNFQSLKTMPKIRLIGNNLLSFFVKACSGYWNVMDPVNGYTAVTRDMLEKLDIHNIARGYFFESDMLLKLNLINAVVNDVPIPAEYNSEKSSLKILNTMLTFPGQLVLGLLKRIFLKYFIYDFNMASVYILLGLPMFLWSFIFGTVQWINSYLSNTPQSAGTIMLAALPLILSTEMLLQAIHIDIKQIPTKTHQHH